MADLSPANFRLRAESLETRLVPAITLRIDYTYDTGNYFAVERRAAIERVAAEVQARLGDTFTAIAPSGSNTWEASFFNSLTNKTVTMVNPTIAANEVVVYVGGGPISGTELAIASGGSFQASGSNQWLNTVRGRGEPGALGNSPTDIAPWGGFIAFDSATNWDFTAGAPGFSQFDFDSVARHEMLHMIGFGLGDFSFDRHIVNGAFAGPNAVALFGKAVPLAPGDNGHWAPGTALNGQTAVMVASIPAGAVRPATELDYAALADMGWEIVSGPSPPPPPPPPPLPPPPPPPPPPTTNTAVRFAVGVGTGGSSTASTVNSDGEPIATIAPFGDFAGGVRIATADFSGDGVRDIVVATGPGRSTLVRVVDGMTGGELFSVQPFEPSFTGGVYVAAGDLTGDGVPELVVTPDEGGGPRVDIYRGSNFAKYESFFGIDDPNFRGGARAAVGDVNGDGRADLLVAAGFGGGPRVAGFNGKSLGTNARVKLFGDFFAFEETLRNGIFLTAGDVNADGRADLIAGGGPGGGPRVLIFSGKALMSNTYVPLGNFFAGDTNGRGGVRLAASDVDGDGRVDLVTGAGENAGSRVTVYDGTSLDQPFPSTLLDGSFYPGFEGGIFVG